MDNNAIEALFDLYDMDDAHRAWLKIAIEQNFSEEMLHSQLCYIEEMISDYAFYGIIEDALEPHKEHYPDIYALARDYNKMTDLD